MRNDVPDPDDFFADTRMSFGDHIEDLRTHLWRAIKGFFLAMALSMCFGHIVLEFIIAPVKDQLHEFYNRRVQTTLKELESDPKLKAKNQPTAFTKLYVVRSQLQAALNGNAGENAPGDPIATAGYARRHGHDDANDQARFKDFAKDNDQSSKHGRLTSQGPANHGTTRKPCVS